MAFSSALNLATETVTTLVQQTAGTSGAMYHSFKWLTTPRKDISYPNRLFTPPVTDVPALKNGVALCCVHGTADNVVSFSDLANFLQDKLPTAVSSIELFAFEKRGRGLGIDDYAEQAFKKIQEKGFSVVMLAGHSRGGLVVRKLEALLQLAGIKVIMCFSIGTPHGGSSLALPPFTLFSDSINEMKKGSPYLAKACDLPVDPDVHVCAVAGADLIVSPEDAILPGAPYRIFPHEGHLSLMHHQGMFKYFHDNLCRKVCKLFPVASVDLSPDEAKAEELSYETIPDPKANPVLLDIYYEITVFLEDWRQRVTLMYFSEKKALFDELREMILTMLQGERVKAYAQHDKFGDFLTAFLADKAKADVTKVQGLRRPLGYVMSFFSAGSELQMFLQRLQTTYQNVALPTVEIEHKISLGVDTV